MSTLDPVRFIAKNLRVDLALIAGMIEPGARVLDIGCGDGTLIDHLFQTKNCDARGIELDMAEVEKAHALYKQHGLGTRDDAIAMQYLIPGWEFDPKRPSLDRG